MAGSARCLVATGLLLLVGVARDVQAGRFRITEVPYEVLPAGNPGAIRVIVTASATYRGPLDAEDLDAFWFIQTFLNDSIGNDLEDWDDPDWWTDGNSGVGIPETGYEVHCDINCGADGAIQKCDAQDDPLQYKGKAGAVIYHQADPEIDVRFAQTQETDCVLYTVGGTVVNLASGNKPRHLILRNNGSDDLTVTESGAFSFLTPLRDGSLYEASILQQPWGHQCRLYGPTATGAVAGDNVTDIVVSCVSFCEASFDTVPRPGDYAAAQANCHVPVLVDNGDGTVADVSNNLLWSRDVVHTGCIGTKFITGGYLACFNLVLGGRDDWQVPDVAQIQTLLPECGAGMTGCDGRFWADSFPPFQDCCPRGFGCGRCHWIAGFGSAGGTLQDGSLGWVDIAQNCGGYTRCVTSLQPN